MREIKLRVRERSSKKVIGYEYFNTPLNDGFYYIDLRDPEDERVCLTNYSDRPMIRPEHPLDRLLREQYTGLKDKNGVEIYEGDIITDGHFKWEAAFLEGCFAAIYPLHGTKNVLADLIFSRESAMKEPCIKVIGNIYENPELLDK